MAVISGHKFLDDLCNALGIMGPVCRIVIDVHVSQAVMVYVERFLEINESVKAVEVLSGIKPKPVESHGISVQIGPDGIEVDAPLFIVTNKE